MLISDGFETCEGDPCAAASNLVSQGIEIKVHAVGFDVSDEARKQLECIAEKGRGRYFQASSTQGFKEAIAEVQQVAQAEPAPKALEPKEYFRDDFDGAELADHWEVLNSNPDTFIVEDGQLLIVSASPGSLGEDTVANLFRLNIALPKGDWVMSVKGAVLEIGGYQTVMITWHFGRSRS